MVNFAGRCVDFAHYNFEMVNKRLHIAVNLVFWRQVIFGSIGVIRSFGKVIDGLLHDAETLPHFFVADHVAVVSIAILSDGDVEFKILVRRVWVHHAHIVIHTRSAQVRACETV
ncbi:hypothetical protein D3C87_1747400 [compost metagenome]